MPETTAKRPALVEVRVLIVDQLAYLNARSLATEGIAWRVSSPQGQVRRRGEGAAGGEE